jgi:hypothetical protein
MPILVLSLCRFVRVVLLSGHGAVAMENAALRVQLVAFQRKPKRPTLTSFDRLFWVGLSLLWARSPGVRPSRHGRPLAARTVSQVLGSTVEGETTPSRATRDGRRDSTPHRADGCGQLSLARTQDSRRVDNARHRDFRTHCLPNPPETAAAARPDLEDVLAQSPRSDGFD